ncbi:hypothetical protein [Candidatus Macondimonas diazotrophica]|uniref:PAS fold-4 domain-containing protein n=1 Tax=Candidatus Macondimonas diazotrophica TaxID=2305248 RepID=A0A4Z0F5S4_9GAMM|nr:hypothetical protein [Candidatus Macondimonas diazotrophica]TFZ81596.1 hypothetical protein E4680_11890 [Candidatus Macondimonas diazotrophica]
MTEMNQIADSYGSTGQASAHLFQFFENHPMPAWIKRSSGYMLRVNRAYQERYGIQQGDYRHDYMQWAVEDADGFRDTDFSVIQEGEPVFAIEHITHPVTSERKTVFVVKWPLEIEGVTAQGLEIQIGATGGFVVAETPYIEDLVPGEIGAEIFIKPDMRWDLRAPKHDRRN